MTLHELGFRPKKRTPTQRFFDAKKGRFAMKPDTDFHPDPEREPQAPKYTQMWVDHWSHWGDVKNPVGSPME